MKKKKGVVLPTHPRQVQVVMKMREQRRKKMMMK